jgi:hypothetical protein
MGEAGHEPGMEEPEASASGADGEAPAHIPDIGRPNPAQRRYLKRGLTQAGGKLPLFDEYGQHVHPALVRACVAHGWAEPWFGNPMKPDWLVCKLTEKGRSILGEKEVGH